MSDQTNHTPGPWQAEWTIGDCLAMKPSEMKEWRGAGWDVIGPAIVLADKCAPEMSILHTEADARLMAAAPDLLAALKETIFLLVALDYEQDAKGEFRPWFTQATDALAKATGGIL